jgi:gluconolactonase
MKISIKKAAVVLLCVSICNCKPDKKEIKETPSLEAIQEYPILEAGKLEAMSEAFWKIIPKNAKLEILAEGHDWTEGPLWVAPEQMLLYTDIPRNAVYGWKEGLGSRVYLKPSGFLGEDFQGEEPGANGLLLAADGSLILCQHGERQIARMIAPLDSPKPEFQVLADRYEGKRFNSPNDAVRKSNGDLYFTDPPYGLPRQVADPGKELPFQGVFRLDSKGEVSLLTSELSRPNGIGFSPDEKTLYLANSDPENAIWKAFDISEDGGLSGGRILHDATSLVSGDNGLPDGMVVHPNGTLFATGPGGVFVMAPSGEVLGRILTGQATSNCTLNEDASFLFLTADSYVLRLRLKKQVSD